MDGIDWSIVGDWVFREIFSADSQRVATFFAEKFGFLESVFDHCMVDGESPHF